MTPKSPGEISSTWVDPTYVREAVNDISSPAFMEETAHGRAKDEIAQHLAEQDATSQHAEQQNEMKAEAEQQNEMNSELEEMNGPNSMEQADYDDFYGSFPFGYPPTYGYYSNYWIPPISYPYSPYYYAERSKRNKLGRHSSHRKHSKRSKHSKHSKNSRDDDDFGYPPPYEFPFYAPFPVPPSYFQSYVLQDYPFHTYNRDYSGYIPSSFPWGHYSDGSLRLQNLYPQYSGHHHHQKEEKKK